jgi:hypothetical protein
MRFFGVLATAALLGTGVAMALTVIPDAKIPSVTTPDTAPAADAPKAAHKKKHAAPAKPKLTKAQRRARAAAVGTLREQGYRPVALGDYEPDHVLRVLVGKGDGGQRAFFFANGRYLGNDTTDDSASIKVARAGNRSVALSYKLAEGGRSRVLFRWDGKKLEPQTAIPPAVQRSPKA